MQPTIEILDRIRKNSRDNKEEIFTRLYRYLLRPDLYYLAYKNLYANKGAGTKGVNDDTADGFSKEKVDRIIQSLADGTYTPNPVRREYIQKKQNSTKKRPLGIPTFTDKLVQEVLRMILESVYEPIFSNNSHGFRPNRSCHTALKSLKREFSGVSWFIEGDIKGCFDNIDHQVLANVINAKIKDARLIQLIWKFLMWLSLLVSHSGAGHGVNQPLSQQAAKSAAAEAERKLVQVGLKMVLGQAVVGSQNERLGIADHNMQPVEHTAVGIIGLMFVGVILKRRDITAVTIAADGAVGCNSTVGKLFH